MSTPETDMIEDLAPLVIEKLRAAKLGLYPAMRILGYLMVAVAECVDLEGEADDLG